jgi:hypothetical protein
MSLSPLLTHSVEERQQRGDLSSQEAEIRRIVVQSQPGANSSRDPILKKGLVEWLKCRP